MQARKSHYFITLEGCEGAGKSTNLVWLKDFLISKRVDVITTREPGGTPMAEEIRNTLLMTRNELVQPKTELLLLFAARLQHVSQIVRPALASGQWVLCDRFVDATYAYQGGGRQIPVEEIAAIEEWTLKGFEPDITLLLDVPTSFGMERLAGRGSPKDRFEEEQVAFYERVRAAYLARAAKYPDRIHVIDASLALEKVQEQIAKVMAAYL